MLRALSKPAYFWRLLAYISALPAKKHPNGKLGARAYVAAIVKQKAPTALTALRRTAPEGKSASAKSVTLELSVARPCSELAGTNASLLSAGVAAAWLRFKDWGTSGPTIVNVIAG